MIPDAYRIDLLVDESLVVELKTVQTLLPVHSSQVLTYLRMSERRLGLLINFHTVRLADQIKRIVHNLSGTEAYNHTSDKRFLMIGERANVAGSPQFAKLVRAGNLEEPPSRSPASRSRTAPTSSTSASTTA
jgi:hypothetical protein